MSTASTVPANNRVELLRQRLLQPRSHQEAAEAYQCACAEVDTFGDPQDRVILRSAVANYLGLRAEFQKALSILNESDRDAGQDMELRAQQAYARATVYNRMGHFQDVRAQLSPFVNGALEKLSLQTAARIRTLYAGALDQLGETYAARLEYHAAIDLRERIGEPRGMAVVYYNFAESCARRDEDDIALEYFVRAFDIERELEDFAGMAQTASHIAILLARRSDATEALRYGSLALDSARKTGTSLVVAHVMANRSAVFELLGKHEEQEGSLLETLEFLRETPIDALLAPTLANLASTYMRNGNHEAAQPILEEALQLACSCGNRYQEGYIRLLIGQCNVSSKNSATAVAELTRAVEILMDVDAHGYALEALRCLADAHVQAGSTADAFHSLSRWIQAHSESHNVQIQKQVRDRDNEIYHLRNVELQRALEELRSVNNELRDLASEKDEFMAMAAHDLRNPLGDARSMLQMIISNYDALEKDDVIQLCGDVLTLTVRMANTIHSFLEVSRTDNRSSGLVIQPLDCNLIVQRATERHSRRAQEKKIHIVASPNAGPCWATGDASIVEAIVDNLLSNALKYTSADNTIVVGSALDEAGPSIVVSDNGPGVDPSKQHLLFTKYANLGARPTGGEESLGLGLYLAQRMAARMGAHIEYSHRVGGGSVFTLRLMK